LNIVNFIYHAIVKALEKLRELVTYFDVDYSNKLKIQYKNIFLLNI